jgi:acyl-CoA oxidase
MTPSAPAPDPGPILPFLPLVYAAWADGALSAAELDGIRSEIRRRELVDPSALEALDAWLDPTLPPSPSELERLRERIRQAAGSLPEEERRGLAALGAAMAPVSLRDRAALDALEQLLGLLGDEAARELMGSSMPRPPSSPAPVTPPFDPSVLRRYLDQDHLETRDRVLSLLREPELRIPPHLPKEEHRARVMAALRRLAAEGLGALGYPDRYGGGGDPARALAVFETLALGDLSVMVKWGVQFGLWGGSIHQLGTERHHERWLRDIGSLALPGCYAMTELSHGSNVRDLETTATWMPEAGEFEIHTPHELAGKEWIGNAALHGRMATVFAQLRVGGEEHGVHAFVVPLRDDSGQPLPGVRIEDCGWKEGLNGVDNGRIWFHRVRVPRENLLDRFGEVTPGGLYHSPIPGAGKRFFTMLGTLVTGRVSIATGSLMAARTALTIAVRFSDRRRQFGPAGGPEVPVLDYLAQQRLLLPKLAATYAYTFTARDLVRRFVSRRDGDEAEALELDGLAAGLKAVASWLALDTLQACREACGGQGYRSDNRFGQLKADVDVFATFEGANVVLLQLLAKGLLSRFREEMGDLRLRGVVRLLAERASTRMVELNPLVVRRTDEAHLRDADFHQAAFRYREERLITSAARRLKGFLDGGMDSFEAMNRCQDHLVELATAHVERVALERMLEAVKRAPTPGVSETLRSLAQLFALDRLEAHRAWYLEAGYMEPAKSRAIRALVNTLCGEVREHAVFLVDAFGIPDEILGAPAGLRPTGV